MTWWPWESSVKSWLQESLSFLSMSQENTERGQGLFVTSNVFFPLWDPNLYVWRCTGACLFSLAVALFSTLALSKGWWHLPPGGLMWLPIPGQSVLDPQSPSLFLLASLWSSKQERSKNWVKEEAKGALLSPVPIRTSGWGKDIIVKDVVSKLWQPEIWGDWGECPASRMSAGVEVAKGDTKQSSSNPWSKQSSWLLDLHSLLIWFSLREDAFFWLPPFAIPNETKDNYTEKMLWPGVRWTFQSSIRHCSCSTGVPDSWNNFKANSPIFNPAFSAESSKTSIIHSPIQAWCFQGGTLCLICQRRFTVRP